MGEKHKSVFNNDIGNINIGEELKKVFDIQKVNISLWTLIGLFFYVLGYLFLYGYQFGGDSTTSLMDILTKIIPFDFKPLLLLGLFWFSIATSFFMLSRLRERDLFITVILGIVLFFLSAIFFVGASSNNIWDYLSFMFIWVIPIFIVLFLELMKKSVERIRNLFVFFVMIFYLFTGYGLLNLSSDWDPMAMLIVIFVSLIYTLITDQEYCKKSGNYYYLLFVPINIFIIFIIYIIYYLVFNIRAIKQFYWIILVTAIIISILLKKFLKNRYSIKYVSRSIDEDKSGPEDLFNSLKELSKKNLEAAIFFILVGFIGCSALISYSSFSVGIYTRKFTSNIPKGIIQYSLNNNLVEIEGRLIAKKDGTYFISDKNYNLITLKVDECQTEEIRTVKDFADYPDEYKWLDEIGIGEINFCQLDDDYKLEAIIHKNGNLVIIDKDDKGNSQIKLFTNVDEYSHVKGKSIMIKYKDNKSELFNLQDKK